MPGPPPKRDSQRRRRNKPASYGAAETETVESSSDPVEAATLPTERKLGFAAHKLIEDLWAAVQTSAEARFYSEADWHRVRIELWYGNQLLDGNRTPGAQAWAAFQAGLNILLVSPADKRRAGIEIKPPQADADAAAADAAIAEVFTLIQGGATGTDGE